MMRYIVYFWVGLILALSVGAQSVAPDTFQISAMSQTNKLLDLNASVASPKVKTVNGAPDIISISDGFSEDGMIGVESETPAVTNKAKASRLNFLASTGVEYTDEGEYKAAERAYLRALKLDPDNEDIQFRLGTLYVAMERFPEAIKIFEKLTVQFPNNPLPHNNLAWCYATGKGVINTARALRHAREALLSAPLSASAWNTLAESYYVAGNYKKALRSSEYAVELLQARMAKEGGGDNTSEKENLKLFKEQYKKILRAEEAVKLLEDPDDE